jgi:hypothetical protein
MYYWVVFLHMVGVFGFLLAHGVSAGVILRLRSESDPERIRALLELSGHSYSVMYPSLLVLLVAGIISGFMGDWWGQGWIWASLVVLVLIYIGMTVRGSSYLTRLRKAVGAEYFEKMKSQPPLTPLSREEIAGLMEPSRGIELLAIGVGGLLIILWLMILKPF